ncbi:MAG: DUF4132 domain-containing protein, partial [Micrococcales bacterium]|nr:DUF4132 domain-containing protein [Micrococcales bacterium]
EFLAGHPVMRHLVATLVWQAWPPDDGAGPAGGYRLCRPTVDGELLDADDDATTLPAGARVGLAHRATVTAAEAERWRAHLADYRVTPPFAQFAAAPPAFAAGATQIADHLGWLSDSFAIRGRALKRGYARGEAEDAGWFTCYVKNLPGAGIRVEIEFTGSFLPEQQIAAAVQRLTFTREGRELALADVPPILLAECYADYVDVAQAGAFDPEWEAKSAY